RLPAPGPERTPPPPLDGVGRDRGVGSRAARRAGRGRGVERGAARARPPRGPPDRGSDPTAHPDRRRAVVGGRGRPAILGLAAAEAGLCRRGLPALADGRRRAPLRLGLHGRAERVDGRRRLLVDHLGWLGGLRGPPPPGGRLAPRVAPPSRERAPRPRRRTGHPAEPARRGPPDLLPTCGRGAIRPDLSGAPRSHRHLASWVWGPDARPRART